MRDTPVALVTGSARRVGREIAVELARSGFDVVVHYRWSDGDAHATAAEIRAEGRAAEVVRADLAAVREIEGLFGEISERCGRLDLLVNNASSYARTPLGTVDESSWNDMVDSNLKGPFFCSQFAAAMMSAAGTAGQIVNIVDLDSERPDPDYLPYSVAKAGLLSLTRGMARALAPTVRVNAVAPGPVLFPDGASPIEKRRATERTLLGRAGSPRDVSETVAFLATGPTYLTGAVIAVDGGGSCRG